MTGLTTLIDQPWTQALAWTLAHFVWQGALIGLAAFALVRLAPLRSSGRYAVGIAALAAMLAAPIGTFAALASGDAVTPAFSTPTSAGTSGGSVAALGAMPGPVDPAGARTSELVAVAVLAAWLAGVLALSVRLLGGWIVARRLVTRAVLPVPVEIDAIARQVAVRLGLARLVRLVASGSVPVPITVGWLKPVVLLPAAALSSLTPDQVEALIAHELAHVRRYDYLVNLLQSVVETLLFYHPAVWWTSRLVRREREHCCDDLAVAVCDRLVYVRALSDMAALATPRLAMAATRGSLAGRVERLLAPERTATETGSSWLAAVLVLALVAAIVPVVLTQSARPADLPTPVAAERVEPATLTPAPVTTAVAEGVQATSARPVEARRESPEAPSSAPAAVVQADAQAAERQRRAEQIQELEREIANLHTYIQAQQAEIERQRVRLELEQADAQSRARIRSLEAALEVAEARLTQTRRRVEVGTDNQEALLSAEAEVSQLRQELDLAARERAFAQARADLQLQELEQRQELEARLAQLNAELARAMRERSEAGLVLSADQMTLSGDQLTIRGGVRASAANERQFEDAVLVSQTTAVADASAEARADDIVVIDIAGESQLPRAYAVGPEGTIRLPLVGDLAVGGLTADRIRDLVATRLAERQLAPGATVRVELRRRAPGSR